MPDADLARLWAPWRMTYIRKAEAAEKKVATRRGSGARRGGKAKDEGGEKSACLFCRVRAEGDDRRDLVVARRPHAVMMLNRFPYNPAHLMVAVSRHAARFADLTDPERGDLLDLTALAERALELEYHPHGMNYGANVGRIAGAGFPGHLHVHLVPRWSGDTNFMPTVAATKVLPESLARTWTRLRGAVRRLGETTSNRSGGKRARSR